MHIVEKQQRFQNLAHTFLKLTLAVPDRQLKYDRVCVFENHPPKVPRKHF